MEIELYGGKEDGRILRVSNNTKEVLVPSMNYDLGKVLSEGDPFEPLTFDTITYRPVLWEEKYKDGSFIRFTRWMEK